MKNTTKRNISILSAVILCASMIVGGTLAYFHDKQEIKNPFSTAKDGISITLEEPNYDPETSKDITPGTTITKDPTITNVEGEAYARFVVKLVEKDTDTVITDPARAAKIMSTLFYDSKFAAGTGSTIIADTSYTQAELAAMIGTDVMTPVNSEFTLDSTRSSDGIYYYNYNGTMGTGDVKTLFTHVAIPGDWVQTDIDEVGDFDLIVEGQAIQKSNIEDADTAFDALDTELTPASAPTP